jgi:hypothetical protein
LREVCAELSRLREVSGPGTVLLVHGGPGLQGMTEHVPIPEGIIACHTMADAVRIARASLNGSANAETALV